MGGWRFGDPNGRRKWFSHAAPFGELPGFQLAYETWGTLNAEASNAVLVLHALTGDSHVAGGVEPGHPTPGWWDSLVGKGKPLDAFFVVAPNVLGGCQGSTGPWQYPGFPDITIRDQVAAEVHLADYLGIGQWAAVLGGSMGGMRAVEWAVSALIG